MATIAVLGDLDTKGLEHQFVADCITRQGHQAILINVGVEGEPQVNPHISRDAFLEMAGFEPEAEPQDQLQISATLRLAAPIALAALLKKRKIQGVVSLGEGFSKTVAAAAMRGLPLGFPKLLVLTKTGETSEQPDASSDIVLMPSIVSISGITPLTRPILIQAAGAVCGMVETARAQNQTPDRPIVFATIFGNTTTGLKHARRVLEEAGYDVITFHATGKGGRAMEALIETGLADGVLDFTTTEWADEIVGGVLSAGPTRLQAAAKTGTPAVVVPGCVDIVNFFAKDTLPKKFKGRTIHLHNPNVTLLRTNSEEARAIGEAMAQRLNQSVGPVSVLLPRNGLSAIGGKDFIFHDPKADHALFTTLRNTLRSTIPVIVREENINDSAFAEACAAELLKNIELKAAGDRERIRRPD